MEIMVKNPKNSIVRYLPQQTMILGSARNIPIPDNSGKHRTIFSIYLIIYLLLFIYLLLPNSLF